MLHTSKVSNHVFVRLATHAMATRFEFALYGDNEINLRAAGEEAIAEIEYLHEKFSYFSPSSIVSRINRLAQHEPVVLDRETFELFMLCRDAWHASGGAFDITIGPLMRAWGFRSSAAETLCGSIDARQAVGFHNVRLDPRMLTIRFNRPGMEIDLGGVAKGYALDRAAAIMRDAGVKMAFLHGGTSSAIAIGSPSAAASWSIRIQDGAEPLNVSLRDAALSVSASRGRTVTRSGQAHGHIIDPRTGAPVRNNTSTAAVIADQAALADAWSTALLVLSHRPPFMNESITSMIRGDQGQWHCCEP